MRIRSAVALLAVCVLSACSGVSNLFKAYEYEEEMYLALDGTATIYVNSSVAALNALRGSSFDTNPQVAPDRDAVRAFFSSPNAHVTRVTLSRRSNRRYVHVRLDVDNIEHLAETKPFAWSTYSFKRDGELYYYKQTVGQVSGTAVGDVGWKGSEIVGFRMHLPSKIVYHNAGPGNPSRGKDAHQGAVLLFSAETGELLAMMNASAITSARTAAVSGSRQTCSREKMRASSRSLAPGCKRARTWLQCLRFV